MLEQIVGRLKAAGIKPSMQRIKIYEYFFHHENHPTAEQIYQDLKKEVPTLSKATVYNTIGLFIEKGLVKFTTTDRQNARYDLTDTDHGHFICSVCNEIYDFPYRFSKQYSDLEGFEIQSEEIVIKGICRKCLKKH